jgi:hypothetical protein
MIAERPKKWILAVCGLAGIFSAIDVFIALKTGESHLTDPNSPLLLACSRALLMVGLISMYLPKRRVVAIAAAVGALALAMWGALIR